MDEQSHNKWDIRIKLISAFLTLSVVAFGVWEYREINTLEFKKGFYETQLIQFDRVTNLAAKISIIEPDSTKTSTFIDLKNEFFVCYYGTVNMVSDNSVEAALINYYTAIEDFEIGKVDNDQMQHLALELTQACRKSILKTWKLDEEKEYQLN